MDLKPAPEIISQRLKGQLTPAYLTLTSIIQGVALAFLAARVEATYAKFDTANWLLTSATFVGFLTLWNEYLMQVLTFVWVPTLVDSLVPFAFLAGELFMAHFVYGGLRYWLLSLGLTFVVGTIASIVTSRQARTFPEENRDVARALTPLDGVRAALSAAILVLCLAAWALYDVLRLEQAQIVVALVALVALIVFLGSSVPYWNRVLAYARGEYNKAADKASA
jgi:hypothetical protein